MKMNAWKLPIAAVLSIGLLLTVATGTTLASEEGEQGSFWDRQEMPVSVYKDSTPDFVDITAAADSREFKAMVKSNAKDGEDAAAVSINAKDLNTVTITKPVDILVEGYADLSDNEQRSVKLVVNLPDTLDEDAPHAMTIQGIPENRVEIKNLGPVSLYVNEAAQESEPAAEE